MLSDKNYAKFFGENLLEEIFHLDEELAQAIAIKEDPQVEEELERSFDIAIDEGHSMAQSILEAAKKPKFHVYSAFGGEKLSSHHTESAAHKAAAKHSKKQPVHVWTASGGEFGMGKAIAHYNNGEKTVYEDFEQQLDAIIYEDEKPKTDWSRVQKAADEFLTGKRKGIPGMRVAKARDFGLKNKDVKLKENEEPSCPECGGSELSIHPYDFGRDSQTGYHDAGERYHCHGCGSKGDADDAMPRKR